MTVHLRAGRYFIESSIVMTAEDSGVAGSPITYRAAGDGPVRLIGGRELRDFMPVTDAAVLERLDPAVADRIVCIDLKAIGLTDYGTYEPRGHGGGSAASATELFFNSAPMTVARWPKKPPLPNMGFDRIVDVRGDALIYGHDRPSRWKSLDGLFLRGYFSLDWASNIVRVTSIDNQKREVTTEPPRCGHYGMRKEGRFFWFNILEELTEPGEYCIDRNAGVLYFLPPTTLEHGECVVSTFPEPMLDLQAVEHVRFERMTFESTRGDGFRIRDGRGVVIAGCVLRGIGWDGVRINDGFDHAVISCDLFDIAECGVNIQAGDKATLTPCNHRVHNCHIHHVAREAWTYFPMVNFSGCGASVTRCRMHDHPHTAVFYWGNDFTVEGNEFYNVTLEGDDCGVMYSGRRFDFQGNLVRHNFFHHVGDSGRNEWGSSGVYMDDGAGGTRVEGNVFQFVNKGVLAGGGINTVVDNNVFIDCSPAVWFDERCASARADRGETMIHGWMKDHFYKYKANEPPYSTAYPLMDYVHAQLQNGAGVQARGCSVLRNIVVGVRGRWLATSWATLPDYFECRDNAVGEDPGFVDPSFGVFAIRPDSPVMTSIGFKAIPFDEIGITRDAYRTHLEDTRTSIRITRAINATGRGGYGMLVVRNTGDIDVAGMERIEIKTLRHGPGVAWVDVPFDVPAGTQREFEFEVNLAPAVVRDVFDLFLCSRGERLRPAWVTMPVAYSLDTRIEAVAPLSTDPAAHSGRVRVTIKNVGETPIDLPVGVTVAPADAACVPGETFVRRRINPGAVSAAEFDVVLDADSALTVSRVNVCTTGEGVRPASLQLVVEHIVSSISPQTTIGQLDQAMRGQPWIIAQRPQSPNIGETRRVHVADVKLALCGGALAIIARVRDPNVTITEMLWDGSSLEVYGCSPDRERIGHVFGNIEIGQVYLTPACGDRPSRGYRFINNQVVEMPDITATSRSIDGGYELSALIPLHQLAVAPDADRFMFEFMAQSGPHPDGQQRRATIFGSFTAYKDASRYAMIMRS
ncbi:MAG: right-handed parallel beta-helix repeat-containing protein [Planctomycetes bacterium]|nr:right-handed parallel beta-helix repeat-containing protein [Planctomycetota bacterium]